MLDDLPEPGVDDLVYHEHCGEHYAPYGTTSATVYHILRGQCTATVGEGEDAHQCPFSATYRRYTEDSIENRCRLHADDEWAEAVAQASYQDRSVISLDQTCSKYVRSETGPDASQKDDGGREFEDDDTDGRVRPCGDLALVMVQFGDNPPKAFCKRHARELWLRPARFPAQMGDRLDEELEADQSGATLDEFKYVVVPDREVFDTHEDWEEAVNGRFPTLRTARRHTAMLKPEESPVSLNG